MGIHHTLFLWCLFSNATTAPASDVHTANLILLVKNKTTNDPAFQGFQLIMQKMIMDLKKKKKKIIILFYKLADSTCSCGLRLLQWHKPVWAGEYVRASPVWGGTGGSPLFLPGWPPCMGHSKGLAAEQRPWSSEGLALKDTYRGHTWGRGWWGTVGGKTRILQFWGT